MNILLANKYNVTNFLIKLYLSIFFMISLFLKIKPMASVLSVVCDHYCSVHAKTHTPTFMHVLKALKEREGERDIYI